MIWSFAACKIQRNFEFRRSRLKCKPCEGKRQSNPRSYCHTNYCSISDILTMTAYGIKDIFKDKS